MQGAQTLSHLPPFWRWYHTYRANFAPPLFAIALTSQLLVRDFYSPWVYMGWGALGLGFITSGTAQKLTGWVAIGTIVLVGSLFLSGIFNLLWGSGNWPLSLGTAFWGGPLALFALIKQGERIFPWLLPTLAIHAFLTILNFPNPYTPPPDGTILPSPGNAGLTPNPNVGAGVLVLGIVYFLSLHSRYHWVKWVFIIFLFTALLFTHSRWGLVVAVALILFHGRSLPWKLLIPLLPVFIVLLIRTLMELTSTNGIITEVEQRLTGIPSTWWLPQGVIETPRLHNVLLRLSMELGIPGAIAWVGLTGSALSRQGPHGVKWCLLAMTLLGMLDYYIWEGHMVGLWWLCLGTLLGPSTAPRGITSSHRVLSTT